MVIRIHIRYANGKKEAMVINDPVIELLSHKELAAALMEENENVEHVTIQEIK